MLAAEALQALRHVDPYRARDPRRLLMAKVGALLENELLDNTRALREHPMRITVLGGGPTLAETSLEELGVEGPPEVEGAKPPIRE
jgi:hypothetical protein